jgi:hypothetical protein
LSQNDKIKGDIEPAAATRSRARCIVGNAHLGSGDDKLVLKTRADRLIGRPATQVVFGGRQVRVRQRLDA